MKITNLFVLVILFALCSCNSSEKSNTQKVIFGIYETIKIKEIPNSVIDTLKTTKIQLENDTNLPIVGYVINTDTVNFKVDYPQNNIRLVKTFHTVDKEGKYYALVAIKQNPAITNSDIKKAKNMGKNVEIHFNMTGAKKWADVIKNNQDNMIAFIIDNQIYTLPYINGEINNGSALINGIEDEPTAKNISESLNFSIAD